jgi:hypothetical protein
LVCLRSFQYSLVARLGFARQKAGKYNLYKVQGMYELWRGRMGTQFSYRAGYVSNPDNLMNAIYAAEEEMRCLMATVPILYTKIIYFGSVLCLDFLNQN